MANRQQRRAARTLPAGATEKAAPETVVQMFDAPNFYASGMQVSQFANDVIITFNTGRIGRATVGGQDGVVVRVDPVANITVSVMTFKEMLIAIKKVVDAYEEEHGEISTPATGTLEP